MKKQQFLVSSCLKVGNSGGQMLGNFLSDQGRRSVELGPEDMCLHCLTTPLVADGACILRELGDVRKGRPAQARWAPNLSRLLHSVGCFLPCL